MASSTSPSTLKLIIDKGPRTGETLEFKSKTVRLGRLVKGNNLQIKDPGISSNHLSIHFNSDTGKWLLTDLDSSNGTILNSSLLEPLSPFEINDGDEIKIGEISLIRVVIVEATDELNSRRYPKRQAGSKKNIRSNAAVDSNLGEESKVRALEGYDEKELVEVEKENKKGRGRGRGRAKKGVVLEEKNNEGGNVKGEASTRVMRSTRRNAEELITLEMVMPTRKTRRGKNVDDTTSREVKEGNVVGDCREVENVGVVGGKATRGGRGGKKKKVIVKEEADEVEDVGFGNVVSGSLPGMESTGIVELKEGPCEEAVDVATLDNRVEDKVSGGVSDVEFHEQERVSLCDREQPCGESVEEVVHENEMCNMMNIDLTNMEVAELLVESSLDATKKPYVDPSENVVQHDKSDHKVNAHAEYSVSVDQQLCSELMNETGQKTELKGDANDNMLQVNIPDNEGGSPCAKEKSSAVPNDESSSPINGLVGSPHVEKGLSVGLERNSTMEDQEVRAAKPVDVSASLNEDVLGPSDVKKGFSDRMESDSDVEDQVRRTCDTRGHPEELGTSYDASRTGGGPVGVSDSGKRTCDTRELPGESDTSCPGRVAGRESVAEPDLSEMTLGEWFDYLEVYLPKQIYTVTDEIIDGMRKRAKQFDEFMLLQQKEKDKLPLVT